MNLMNEGFEALGWGILKQSKLIKFSKAVEKKGEEIACMARLPQDGHHEGNTKSIAKSNQEKRMGHFFLDIKI